MMGRRRAAVFAKTCITVMFTYRAIHRAYVVAAERSSLTVSSTSKSGSAAFVTALSHHHAACSSLSQPFSCHSRRGLSGQAQQQRRRMYPKLKQKHSDGVEETLYRADRVVANRTGKSRSECTQLLKQQRIFIIRYDNEATAVPGPSAKISMHAHLRLDKTQIIPALPPLLVAYHKPKWILSVKTDPLGRPCLDDSTLCDADIPPDMHPVGRLDYDSSGLLLFSSNGALTQTLLHPKHRIPKEYLAVVAGLVDVSALARLLQQGVETSDGVFSAELLEATVFDETKVPAYLQGVRDSLPPEYTTSRRDSSGDDADEYIEKRTHLQVLSDATTQLSTVRLVVREGKYRMVRRILANCGHPVVSLHRERIGEISIQDLPVGACRPLTPLEAIWAHGLVPKEKQKKK